MAAIRGAMRRCVGILSVPITLASCIAAPPPVAIGAVAREASGAALPQGVPLSRIRPSDRLNVRVLFDPELSSPDVRVDSSGTVSLPIVGDVKAAGLTTGDLASLVQTRLRQYVKEPQVTVALLSTSGDHVVVEGSVTDPGVYDIAGSAGLLEVLARAKSPNRTASLSQVIVFRQIDGRRTGAVFNVSRIRRGTDAEPQLYPGDTVVVGFSFVKGAYRDFLIVAPAAVSIFRFY